MEEIFSTFKFSKYFFRNYLDHLPSLNLSSFESDLMKTEFERLSGRQPMDTLSMKRYELPTPPPGKMTDVQVHKNKICIFLYSNQ